MVILAKQNTKRKVRRDQIRLSLNNWIRIDYDSQISSRSVQSKHDPGQARMTANLAPNKNMNHQL